MFYKLFANSADADQTAPKEQSDKGLYCWLMYSASLSVVDTEIHSIFFNSVIKNSIPIS